MGARATKEVVRGGQPKAKTAKGKASAGMKVEPPAHKFLYTIPEAAAQLGVSRPTFYRMLNSKYPTNYRPELVIVEVGGRRCVPYTSLAKLVNNLLIEQGLAEYTAQY